MDVKLIIPYIRIYRRSVDIEGKWLSAGVFVYGVNNLLLIRVGRNIVRLKVFKFFETLERVD